MNWSLLQPRAALSQLGSLNRLIFDGGVALIDGDRELFSGISIHLIGGHSRGLQCIQVRTEGGPVVLASDTAHYYENLTNRRPFPVQHDIEASLRGFERVIDLSGWIQNVIPGHDLGLMERYEPPDEQLRGRVR